MTDADAAVRKNPLEMLKSSTFAKMPESYAGHCQMRPYTFPSVENQEASKK
jgi:hypothetical protein